MYDQEHMLNTVFGNWRQLVGASLVAIALLIVTATFLPLFVQEFNYYTGVKNMPVVSTEATSVGNPNEEEVLVPVDEEFGIVIPKIRANSRVHSDIDWTNEALYQKVLQTGVAQARGTSTPDQPGNMFLFSHSGVDFYEATRYNAEFYLLGKLEQNDEVDIFYKGQKYTYTVRETKIVSPDEVEYLGRGGAEKTVTLMTCWPAGTTYKRLIVIAEQKPL
jgi:LPXTG-site transpeptidase (sortase) family protein